jgi:hypothetical protein
MALLDLVVVACVIAGQSAPRASDPREPRGEEVGISYWGVCTGVTKDSITVQYKDWKPRTFPVNDVLARGDFQMYPRIGRPPYRPRESCMYPLTDVKVGDWVNLKCARVDGKVICDHINISKRPGGKVPPLPKEAEDLMRTTAYEYIPYHEQMDALWNLQDHGIPYPAKFGVRRKFPEAPPPREVKR